MTTLAPPPTSSPSSGHRAAPLAGDPRWTRPALWAILLAATALYAWNITSISGNSFYNAAVYSGTKSWKAFFFGALDSGSFITVDKPPFALWVMGLSARATGHPPPVARASPAGHRDARGLEEPALCLLLAQSPTAAAKVTSAVSTVPPRRPGALSHFQ